MFTVAAWLQLQTVTLTVCLGGEMLSRPSASLHLLTHSVTRDHTGLPASQRPMQLACFLFFFFNPLQEFYTCGCKRTKLFQKKRDYSHFNHTSTINLLLDNVPLLLSVIAVASPHLRATHFKVKKPNVHVHSSASFLFFFFLRCVQCLLPGNHKTAS